MSVQHFDLSGRTGRALVVGDIHGCFDLLRTELAKIGYDAAADTLFLLGDIVDRGPQSATFADWLHLPRVLGNHEVMCRNALTNRSAAGFHRRYGGAWFDRYDQPTRERMVQQLMDAPLAIELVTPRGRKVGLIHADVDGYDWVELIANLRFSGMQGDAGKAALWGRTRIGDILPGQDDFRSTIDGIDHVFFGHSVVAVPVTAGNCSWIDTGSSFTGKLTIVDIDRWLDRDKNRVAAENPPPGWNRHIWPGRSAS